MARTTYRCIVLARNAARIIRNRVVTTLDEVRALHEELPKNDIGVEVLEDGVADTSVDWMYFPEQQCPNWYC